MTEKKFVDKRPVSELDDKHKRARTVKESVNSMLDAGIMPTPGKVLTDKAIGAKVVKTDERKAKEESRRKRKVETRHDRKVEAKAAKNHTSDPSRK